MEKEHVGLWFMCKMNNSLPWCQGSALWILTTLQHPDEMLDVKLLENMEALWLSKIIPLIPKQRWDLCLYKDLPLREEV
jgi:hypothetical protein